MKLIDIHLECTTGSSNKFWRGQIIRKKRSEYTFTAKFGRIGTAGTNHIKDASTVFFAFNLLLKKVREKINKGYSFKSDSALHATESFLEKSEPDLRIALSRFLASASSLSGWIDIRADIKMPKTTEKTKREKRPSSIKKPATKVYRKPLIII